MPRGPAFIERPLHVQVQIVLAWRHWHRDERPPRGRRPRLVNAGLERHLELSGRSARWVAMRGRLHQGGLERRVKNEASLVLPRGEAQRARVAPRPVGAQTDATIVPRALGPLTPHEAASLVLVPHSEVSRRELGTRSRRGGRGENAEQSARKQRSQPSHGNQRTRQLSQCKATISRRQSVRCGYEHMFVRRKQAEYEQARALRRRGWSMRRIAGQVGVALSTVSLWVRDLPRPPAPPQPKAPRPRPCDRPSAKGTRHCPRCDETRPLGEFNRMKDGHQGWCRSCFSSYFRARGKLHREQTRASRRRRAVEAAAFIDDYLAARRCTDCGLADPEILEFDHVGEKRREITVMVGRGQSVKWLREELKHCQVVCVNCHRLRTAQLQNSWRANLDRALELPLLTPHERRNVTLVRRHLIESVCADCGCADTAVLEFDHVRGKNGRVSRMARNGCSLARLEAEIALCEVRCGNCHRRRTRTQLGHRIRGRKLAPPP